MHDMHYNTQHTLQHQQTYITHITCMNEHTIHTYIIENFKIQKKKQTNLHCINIIQEHTRHTHTQHKQLMT